MKKYKMKIVKRKAKVQNLKFIFFCFTFFAFSFTFLSGCQDRKLYKDNCIAMGTFVEVISPDSRAPQIVFSEIKRIEDLLSKYNPQSEISRLNRLGKLRVSQETFYVIKKAKMFWKASGGAFDITVAPLVDLWGFTDRNYTVPQEDEIKEVMKLVGSEKIILSEQDFMVKLILKGMRIDLGAIAKGYALDSAARKLKGSNINNCLINAGGQIYCLGDRFGRPWNIGIRDARAKNIIDTLVLKDRAVSTSGDYEQYFVRAGKRYMHIIDPKTGYPAEAGILSASVVAQDGLTADALSTAIFILGSRKGMELAKNFPDVQVKIIEEKR